ncbi:chemotaxis protein CheD [Pseudalkalibacillus sp. SCS-8]|uniref:chemotaxis protein CheD n=1 Tax=Pseudalkalibacillus nanhaiensis TaxID=3115291 RepID=UPI0032D9DFAF
MNKTIEIIQVKISDYQLAKAPHHLKTTGLGSCVGVVIYEQAAKVAGMAHVMLPSSTMAREVSFNFAKYADTALPAMVDEMVQTYRLRRDSLVAKIAGGAQMFQFSGKSEALRVGPRNVEAVKETLHDLDIPVISEDVGGSNGRTITFDSENGILQIRTIHKGITTI